MKNWINKHIENEVKNEAEKSESFAKEYGGFAFWGGIVGGIVLGIVGGFFDAAVLYGIIFTWLNAHWWSMLWAVLLAVTIQLAMGWGIVKTTKSLSLQQYQKGGFSYYLGVALLISAIMTGASLYLSWNTDKLVGVIASPLFDEQKEDLSDIRDKYNAQILHAESVSRSEITELRKQANDLSKDVIMYKGVKSIRERSMRTRNDILRNQIPKMENGLSLRLAEISELQKQEIDEAKLKNSNTEKSKFATIAAGGNTTKGANIFLNLFRCLILISYTVFITHSIAELRNKDDADNALITDSDNAITELDNVTLNPMTKPITATHNVSNDKNNNGVKNAANVVITDSSANDNVITTQNNAYPLSLRQSEDFETTDAYIDYLLEQRTKKQRTYNTHKSKLKNGKGNAVTNQKAMERNASHIHQIDLIMSIENVKIN